MASLVKVSGGACLCPSHSKAQSVYKPSNSGRIFTRKHFSNSVSLKLSQCTKKKLLNAGKRSNREDHWRLFCYNVDESSDTSPQFDLIHRFYDGINEKDVETLNQLLQEDCIFMDLIFYMPYGGRQSIINFLCDVMDAMGPNIRFFMDGMESQGSSVTVTWHLGWKEKEIPFTAGCTSFYWEETDGRILIRKIIGLEELPVKPGELVLKLLKATGTIFDNFPFAAEGLLQKSDGQERLDMLLELLGIKPKS